MILSIDFVDGLNCAQETGIICFILIGVAIYLQIKEWMEGDK